MARQTDTNRPLMSAERPPYCPRMSCWFTSPVATARQGGVVDGVVHDPVIDCLGLGNRILDPADDPFTKLMCQAVIGYQLGGLKVAAENIFTLGGDSPLGDIEMTIRCRHQGLDLELSFAAVGPFGMEYLEVTVGQAAHAGKFRIAIPTVTKRPLEKGVLIKRQWKPQARLAGGSLYVDGSGYLIGSPVGRRLRLP